MSQTAHEHEIVLVDNGSDDGSVEYVKRNFPFVRIVENAMSLGFAGGNNGGLESAGGDYLVVLNNDTRVSPNFIEALVNCASSDPEIGSVGCSHSGGRLIQIWALLCEHGLSCSIVHGDQVPTGETRKVVL